MQYCWHSTETWQYVLSIDSMATHCSMVQRMVLSCVVVALHAKQHRRFIHGVRTFMYEHMQLMFASSLAKGGMRSCVEAISHSGILWMRGDVLRRVGVHADIHVMWGCLSFGPPGSVRSATETGVKTPRWPGNDLAVI